MNKCNVYLEESWCIVYQRPYYLRTYSEGYKVGYRKGYHTEYMFAFKSFRGLGKPRLSSKQNETQNTTNGIPPNYTYYEILNVEETAKQKEIKSAYLKMIKSTRKNNLIVLINKANSVLSDPKKRRKYDADLKAARAIDEPTGPGSTESGTEEETNEEPTNEESTNANNEANEANEANEENEANKEKS